MIYGVLYEIVECYEFVHGKAYDGKNDLFSSENSTKEFRWVRMAVSSKALGGVWTGYQKHGIFERLSPALIFTSI